ncbi:ribose-phosphate diphosphokinase [Patescibacteria group bacterium]
MERFSATQRDEIVIVDAGANPAQAKKISELLGAKYGMRECTYFPDTDPFWRSEVNLRGKWVIVHQPIGITADGSTSDNLVRLLVAIDAIGRATADRIDLVIPYMPARQDRKSAPREPITARMICDVIMAIGRWRLRRAIFVDLHSPQIQGFMPSGFPADPLFAGLLITDYFTHWYQERGIAPKDICIVGPDLSMDKLVEQLAIRAGLGGYAVVKKKRKSSRRTESGGMIGRVEGMHCFMLDDEISTFSTGEDAVAYLLDHGAESVSMGCTHGKFVDDPLDRLSTAAIERIEASRLERLVVTNTLPWRFSTPPPDKIKVIDIAPFLAEVVHRSVNNLSISEMWNGIKT